MNENSFSIRLTRLTDLNRSEFSALLHAAVKPDADPMAPPAPMLTHRNGKADQVARKTFAIQSIAK